jgi:hypothetical protein
LVASEVVFPGSKLYVFYNVLLEVRRNKENENEEGS